MVPMNGVIYMYTSPSGKQYIGQTVNEHRRKSDHKLCNQRTPFHYAVKKYGYDNFVYEILHKNISTKNELNRLEYEEIQKQNTLYPLGYNLRAGGGQSTLHKSTLEKLGRAVLCVETGKVFTSTNQAAIWATGKPDGSAIRRVCCEANRNGYKCNSAYGYTWEYLDAPIQNGHKRPAKTWTAVVCVETGKTYRSMRQAAKCMSKKGGSQQISSVINNPDRTAYGYHWCKPGFKIDFENLSYKRKPGRSVPIFCVETGVKYISATDAQNITGISRTAIQNAIKSGGKSGGYHWRYV